MTDLFSMSLFVVGLGAIFVAIVFTAAVLAVGSRTRRDPAVEEPANAASDSHATIINEAMSRAQLAPTGREVFFATPPYPSPLYELKLAGILRNDKGGFSDAFYKTDSDHNFTKQVDWLRMNGSPLHRDQYEFVAADRYEHRYTIRFRRWGDERLTLALGRVDAASWRGAFTAEVTVLPAASVTTKELRWQKEASEQQEKARQASEQAARKKQSEAAERFATQIQALCIRAETFPNLNDPEYLAKYARVHGDELIEDQEEIRDEAAKLLVQHRHIMFLRRHNPVAVNRLLGRLQALHLAEQVALDKVLPKQTTIAAMGGERPKPKLNAEKVRELKLWRQQRDMEDKLTLVKDKIAREQQTKAWVLQQYPHLETDEQEAMYQQVLEHLYEDDHNGKIL